MRILTISNLYPPNVIGGYEMLCAQMVDELQHRGHAVQVLTSSRVGVFDGSAVQRTLRLADIYDAYARASASAAVWRETEARARLVDAHNVGILLESIRGFQPEVVYLWNLDGLGGLGIVGALAHLRIPWVWHLQDCVPRLLCSTRGRLVRGMVQATSPFFDGVYIAVSQGVVEEIQQAGVDLGDRVVVLPNWANALPPPRRNFDFRPGELLRLSFVGQVTREKGIHILLEALADLRSRTQPNIHLDVFGAVLDTDVPGYIRRLNVQDVVTLHGWVDNATLLRQHGEHHLLVLPSWSREPFALAPLEAASQGCVTLISADSGGSEWWLDGVDCLKADRTPRAIADVLERVLAGEVDLAVLSSRGMSLCAREFSVGGVAARVEHVLRDAARTAHPRTSDQLARTHRLARVSERVTMALLHQD